MTIPLRLYHKTMIVQHIVITAAVIFLCVVAYFVGWQLITTLQTIDTAGNDVHTTFQTINKPRTGTLAGIDEAIFGASALMKHANGILDHEEKQLSTLDKQEAQLFGDLHLLATNANGEVNSLNTATTTLNTLLGTINTSAEKVPPVIDNLNKITVDADAKINDPAVKKLMDSLSDTSVQVDGISTNLNKVSTHLEKTIDQPATLKQKILGTFDLLWKIGMLAK